MGYKVATFSVAGGDVGESMIVNCWVAGVDVGGLVAGSISIACFCVGDMVDGFCVGGLVFCSNSGAGFGFDDLADGFCMDIGVDVGVGRMLIGCGVGGITGITDIGILSGFEFSRGTGGGSSCDKGSGTCWTLLVMPAFTMVP